MDAPLFAPPRIDAERGPDGSLRIWSEDPPCRPDMITRLSDRPAE